MSFDYRIACASSVSQVCETNRSNFYFDGRSMKKDNRGTATPLTGSANSDAEQCVGIFEGISGPESSHIAINCLRYFLGQKNAADTDYIKHLRGYFAASDRVIAGIEGAGDKRVSAAVAFLRYNGLYLACAGDCLAYIRRNGELTPLAPQGAPARPLGTMGGIAPEVIYGEVYTGDRIIICTTALKKSISNERFRAVANGAEAPDTCAATLCGEAMARGITDCASCCVIDIGKKTSEGYWTLPALVYTPAPEATAAAADAPADTVEILAGAAASAVYESSDMLTPRVYEQQPVPSAVSASGYAERSVNTAAKAQTLSEKRRAAERKKKLIIAAVTAAALILATIVIVAVTAGNGTKEEDTSPQASDLLNTGDPHGTSDTADRDTEEDDTSGNTAGGTTDDTSDDTSDDPEDTSDQTSDTSSTSADPTTDEPDPEEPDESSTALGYTVTNRDGAYYVQVGSTEILVANKTYELSQNYNPGGLTAETKSAFNDLVEAALRDGYTITNISGFRSYATQQRVYSGWVSTYGQEQADRISARPGHSEHQTGMAIDVNSLEDTFGDTAEGRWLAKNAHKFGFIIRYPKGKESVTGYAYEPWHIRYVGELAEDIYNSGLTLEEYLGITSSYSGE